jgi:hypothetical protein
VSKLVIISSDCSFFYKEYNFFCGSVASVFTTISFHWSDRHGTGLQVDFFRILPNYCKSILKMFLESSVADPDPHIFWPPGSGSVSISQKGTDPDPAPNLDPSIIQQNY